MVGCEADPGTPIYLTDSYEDGISLLEAENMRLTKPCSTAWRTKESIRLDREEYDALYCFAYDVIVSLYSHSYTTADEALLSDAYRRMTPTLAAAVKESQYFENHLRNIKENEIYALMKYLSIANGGYVDVVKMLQVKKHIWYGQRLPFKLAEKAAIIIRFIALSPGLYLVIHLSSCGYMLQRKRMAFSC